MATSHNRAALRAYRTAIFSIVPGIGLVAGPLACALGILAWRRGRREPRFTARGPVVAAMVLGALTAATNWAGFALMFAGLRRAGWF
jgi:hypothetical protein